MSLTMRGIIPCFVGSPMEFENKNCIFPFVFFAYVSIALPMTPSIVCVLPDDVCPYANIVPLYPASTSDTIDLAASLYTFSCDAFGLNTLSNK